MKKIDNKNKARYNYIQNKSRTRKKKILKRLNRMRINIKINI